MRNIMRVAAGAVLAAAAAAPALAANVGVSVSVGQPGFYGRIDIGNYPQPVLVYPQPVVVAPSPVAVVQQPIYLHVPPGHAKNWSRYCGRYNACGQRVYFVQDNWYNKVYVPAYRERHAGYRDDRRRKDYDRGRDRRDDHNHDRDHGKGYGKDGRGPGHGNRRD